MRKKIQGQRREGIDDHSLFSDSLAVLARNVHINRAFHWDIEVGNDLVNELVSLASGASARATGHQLPVAGFQAGGCLGRRRRLLFHRNFGVRCRLRWLRNARARNLLPRLLGCPLADGLATDAEAFR
jgi:hypothetical protein